MLFVMSALALIQAGGAHRGSFTTPISRSSHYGGLAPGWRLPTRLLLLQTAPSGFVSSDQAGEFGERIAGGRPLN
jgi:hypothetical protein